MLLYNLQITQQGVSACFVPRENFTTEAIFPWKTLRWCLNVFIKMIFTAFCFIIIATAENNGSNDLSASTDIILETGRMNLNFANPHSTKKTQL